MSHHHHQISLTADHQVLTDEGSWYELGSDAPLPNKIVCYDHDTELLHFSPLIRSLNTKTSAENSIYLYQVDNTALSFQIGIQSDVYVKNKFDDDYICRSAREVFGRAMYYKKGAPEFDGLLRQVKGPPLNFKMDRLWMFILPRIAVWNKTFIKLKFRQASETSRLHEILSELPDIQVLQSVDDTIAYIFRPDRIFPNNVVKLPLLTNYSYDERDTLLMDLFAGTNDVNLSKNLADGVQSALVFTGYSADIHQETKDKIVRLHLLRTEPYEQLYQPTLNDESVYAPKDQLLISLSCLAGQYPLVRRSGVLCIL